jgi:hypothetical protein
LVIRNRSTNFGKRQKAKPSKLYWSPHNVGLMSWSIYAPGARHFVVFDFAAPAFISSAVINGVSFAETLPDIH